MPLSDHMTVKIVWVIRFLLGAKSLSMMVHVSPAKPLGQRHLHSWVTKPPFSQTRCIGQFSEIIDVERLISIYGLSNVA